MTSRTEQIEDHIADVIPLAQRRPRVLSQAEFDKLTYVSPATALAATQQELPDELVNVPGLVGNISRWITKTALYPQPTLSLGAALTIIGTAAGRKFAGPTKSGTHLYALCLAPTGAGKNHPARQAKRIMRAADMKEMLGPSIFMSDSAVYQYVSAQPQMLCLMDEFGNWLSKINAKGGGGYEKAISGILRTLWGASFDIVYPPAWAKSSSRDPIPPIDAPSLSIYGMSVPEEFYAALQSADIANGFLNRFLVLSTQIKPEEVDDPLDDSDVPVRHIVEPLKEIAASSYDPKRPRLTTNTGHAPWAKVDFASAEARLVYKAFKKQIEERTAADKLFSRTNEMAIRLATIRAIGREWRNPAPTIDVDDMTWACGLATWSAERMSADAEAYMVESDHQGRANEVLRHLRDPHSEGRMTMTDLSRKVKHKYDARVLKLILEGLEEAGQVELLKVQPEVGRPVTYIVLKG